MIKQSREQCCQCCKIEQVSAWSCKCWGVVGCRGHALRPSNLQLCSVMQPLRLRPMQPLKHPQARRAERPNLPECRILIAGWGDATGAPLARWAAGFSDDAAAAYRRLLWLLPSQQHKRVHVARHFEQVKPPCIAMVALVVGHLGARNSWTPRACCRAAASGAGRRTAAASGAARSLAVGRRRQLPPARCRSRRQLHALHGDHSTVEQGKRAVLCVCDVRGGGG